MSSRSTLALALLGVAVLAGGIGLVIAVQRGDDRPAAATTTVTRAPAQARPSVSTPSGGYTKFVAPVGAPPNRFDGNRAPIPEGGFARWTGREGTAPGEMEEYATVAGLRLDVALEQRRSTVLAERTADPKLLAEILGAPPSAEVAAAIQKHASVLHDATANIQVDAREGSLSAEDAIRETRAAEDVYRRGFQTATGLTDQAFDRFFAPER